MYTLAEACRNTFILFDCLGVKSLTPDFFCQVPLYLQTEDRDDALILTEGRIKGGILSACMLVMGPDGVLGEFCGNGARACAAYLHWNYPLVRQFFLLTRMGNHPLSHYKDGDYAIGLPHASFKLNKKFVADPVRFRQYGFLQYVEMMEPHVILESKMSEAELFDLGRKLNGDKQLFPQGINVNAWHVLEEGVIDVKTYERGVQRLTRSCGTGSAACASFYKAQGVVDVHTPGGRLTLRLQRDGIELKGPATFFDKDKKERGG